MQNRMTEKCQFIEESKLTDKNKNLIAAFALFNAKYTNIIFRMHRYRRRKFTLFSSPSNSFESSGLKNEYGKTGAIRVTAANATCERTTHLCVYDNYIYIYV